MHDIVPTVHKVDALGGTELLRELQALARRMIGYSERPEIVPCGIHGLYATKDAVAPHTDGASRGMTARGIVIVNEGHRLHSRRLDAAGVTEGLTLGVGDFYEHDPQDEHWTTTPSCEGPCTLAFYVTEEPPERTRDEIIEEMTAYLAEELQYAD